MKEDWDFNTTVRREGNKKTRVVVSVAMGREDFETLTREAEAHSMPVSTYIREAVRKRVHPVQVDPIQVTAGNSSGGPLTVILEDGRRVD